MIFEAVAFSKNPLFKHLEKFFRKDRVRILKHYKTPFFYSLPPVGHGIPASLLVKLLKTSRDFEDFFLECLKKYLGISKLLFLFSGRSALWLILKVLSARKPEKREVVVPAYTCPAVVSAILKANLKPVLCDVDLDDFGYALEDLGSRINRRTLAVVVVHLFGYPANTKYPLEWGRQIGFDIIEDSAQAFGNSSMDRPAMRLGVSGDASFFSFGRGKPLSVLQGGLLATQSEEYYSDAQKLYSNLGCPTVFEKIKFLFMLAVYNLFLNPYLYWIPQKSPFLKIGETVFEEDFARQKGLDLAIRAISFLLKTVEGNKRTRAENARCFSQNLSGLPGVKTPAADSYPFLRYPLRVRDRQSRDNLLNKLNSHGTGAALYYPCPLNELDGLRGIIHDSGNYPNAKRLAETLITLPVHEGLTPALRNTIVSMVHADMLK
jgi:dTDP-4-amino-4,6-dideoxygalactose transaminase